jgi:hypothetical protein
MILFKFMVFLNLFKAFRKKAVSNGSLYWKKSFLKKSAVIQFNFFDFCLNQQKIDLTKLFMET